SALERLQRGEASPDAIPPARHSGPMGRRRGNSRASIAAMEARALVVGGDGRIARALIPALARHGYEVVATTRRRVPDAARVELAGAGVAGPGSAGLPGGAAGLVCGAMSSDGGGGSDEPAARAVNGGAPAAIARALRGSGAQLVILSTNG